MYIKKKKMKDAGMLAGAGIGLGVASSLAPGVAPVASAVKPVGTMIGAGMVLDAIGGLNKQVKKMGGKK